MVWSQLADLQTPPILTMHFLYLRLIGDRSIEEKDFGRIQIDRVLEMEKWAENIKAIENERIKLRIMTANNHYGDTIRKKNRKCWYELREERRSDIETERNVHDGEDVINP